MTKPRIYYDPEHAWWTDRDMPWIMTGRPEDPRPAACATWAEALRFALMPSAEFIEWGREDMGS